MFNKLKLPIIVFDKGSKFKKDLVISKDKK